MFEVQLVRHQPYWRESKASSTIQKPNFMRFAFCGWVCNWYELEACCSLSDIFSMSSLYKQNMLLKPLNWNVFAFYIMKTNIHCLFHTDVALMECSDFMQQLRSFKPQSLGSIVARRKSSTTLIFPLPPQACSGEFDIQSWQQFYHENGMRNSYSREWLTYRRFFSIFNCRLLHPFEFVDCQVDPKEFTRQQRQTKNSKKILFWMKVENSISSSIIDSISDGRWIISRVHIEAIPVGCRLGYGA